MEVQLPADNDSKHAPRKSARCLISCSELLILQGVSGSNYFFHLHACKKRKFSSSTVSHLCLVFLDRRLNVNICLIYISKDHIKK